MGKFGWSRGKHADRQSLVSASLPSLHLPELDNSLDKYRRKNHVCETDSSNPAGPSQDGAAAVKKPSTPKLDPYWQSTIGQQLLEAGKKLRFSSAETLLSEADRSTPQWQEQVADYLNRLAVWTPDQENSEADYYHDTCIVLTALIELAPPGPLNDNAFQRSGNPILSLEVALERVLNR
ncbi:MAG: hypothetical protein ABSH31_22385 [Bryobacteraceae bacterium]|jgi:hypothetical protein